MKALSCDSRLDCYQRLLSEHDYDLYGMNYAPFNDYIEMMKRKIWINRAFGVGYGFKPFLIRAAWCFWHEVYILAGQAAF